MKKLIFLAGTLLLATGLAFAADRASEADMFGGDAATPTPAVSTHKVKAETDDKGLSPDAFKPKAGAEENLQIGGTLSSEFDYYLLNNVPFLQNTASNPNILFLYLDSKLENDSRVFGKIRAFYDPTGVSGGNFNTASFTNPYGFGLGTSDNLSVSLDELKISANIDRVAFFTIGRQKVKYGAAKFFNPTDFLNPTPFNFFLPSDERPGVDMVKMHIPSGTANLYAAALAGNPTTGSQSGGYFRGELGYDPGGSFLGSGEISLSGWFPRGQTGKGGFDISQALGDLDFYVEGAAGQDSGGNWKDAVSAGASIDIRYADRSTNTVTLEAEYAQAGSLFEYGVFAILLAGPGSLTDITFVETNLFDFNAQNGLSRLDIICQFTDKISGRVYGSAPWGTVGGGFYFPGELAQTGMRMDVNF